MTRYAMDHEHGSDLVEWALAIALVVTFLWVMIITHRVEVLERRVAAVEGAAK